MDDPLLGVAQELEKARLTPSADTKPSHGWPVKESTHPDKVAPFGINSVWGLF